MSYSVCKFRHKMCDGCMNCYVENDEEENDKTEEEDEDDQEL